MMKETDKRSRCRNRESQSPSSSASKRKTASSSLFNRLLSIFNRLFPVLPSKDDIKSIADDLKPFAGMSYNKWAIVIAGLYAAMFLCEFLENDGWGRLGLIISILVNVLQALGQDKRNGGQL
jgi:hypothetical protein